MVSKVIIKLNDVTKIYDNEVVAVSKINLEVKEGITGFVGPNGSGKTTILKLLLGQLTPDTGNVRVLGEDPFYNYKLHKEVVMINELMNLKSFNFMRVGSFVKKFGMIGLPKKEAEINSSRALRIVSLDDAKDKRIFELSKGMRQRLKIAYALTINPSPRLILADEPLSGLDPLGRQDIFNLLRNLYNDYGTSTFISSHLLFEVDYIATKGLVLIFNGKIIATGKTHQIRKLLSEYPYRFKIVCNLGKGKVLAQILLEKGIATVTIQSKSNQDEVLVATQTPQVLYDSITNLLIDESLKIEEFINLEEDIATESIFEYLMR